LLVFQHCKEITVKKRGRMVIDDENEKRDDVDRCQKRKKRTMSKEEGNEARRQRGSSHSFG
jgi:hypothetical protein